MMRHVGAEEVALLGGAPVRRAPFPARPPASAAEERAVLAVLRDNRRDRGWHSERLERALARIAGTRHCTAHAGGASAVLEAAMAAVGAGPGGEVIVSAYGGAAAARAALARYALPVFADCDRETFQADASAVAAAITRRTRAIVAAHFAGCVCDLDAILAVAAKRGIPVIEDSGAALYAEWRGRKVGSVGAAGCFTFDGDACGAVVGAHESAGCFPRLGGLDAASLLARLDSLDAAAQLRERNAAHLAALLRDVPGVDPARPVEGATRNARHRFVFRYDAAQFAGLPRVKFLRALAAERIPCSGGDAPAHGDAATAAALAAPAYRRIFPRRLLAAWRERSQCPAADRLAREAVWLSAEVLLDSAAGMEQVAAAVHKIRAAASALAGA